MSLAKLFVSRLWNESEGFLVSLELILVALMLVFGMIVGFQVLRDATVQELADLGQAIGAINNTYEITGVQGPTLNGGSFSVVEGSKFSDVADLNDNATPAGGMTLGNGGVPE